MGKLVCMLFMIVAFAAPVFAAERIDVFPARPYDRLIMFEALALFWIGIIGLVVIIRMKLSEIERTRRMGIDREEKDAPLLD